MSGEHDHCPLCGDDMCDGRCYDALLDRLANAGIDLIAKDRRIKELEAIVAKLPHTADGVPVVPGSVVWTTAAKCSVVYIRTNSPRIGITSCGSVISVSRDLVYSTPQAAEKASKA